MGQLGEIARSPADVDGSRARAICGRGRS